MLLTAVMMLHACSAIKLGYNNVQSVGYWWLNGYFDFNDEQAARLKAEMNQFHQWHRSSELPEYAELLQRAQGLVANGDVTAPQACALVTEARKQVDDITARAEAALVDIAMTFTPAQIEHLEAKYAKNNAEYRKDWLRLSPQEVRKKRYEKTLERTEMIYGKLDEPQRAVIRQQVESSSFDPQLSNTERLRRQQDTLQTLRTITTAGTTREQATQAMHGLLERYKVPPQPQYRAYVQKQWDEGCQGFALAHNAATPAQRETAVKRLKGYERDFMELASQR